MVTDRIVVNIDAAMAEIDELEARLVFWKRLLVRLFGLRLFAIRLTGVPAGIHVHVEPRWKWL